MITKNTVSMKIPLLDLKVQYRSIKKEIDEVVHMIMDEQIFIMGPEIGKLEKEIADYCGTSYAVGVASGTDALLLSIRALGIGQGDEIITTPFTFIATGGAVHNAGARPVFCDIDPKTFNIDPKKIEKLITKNTKAIIPVHLYGLPAEMDDITAIAKKHGLKVIEDNAQGIGATYKGKVLGSMGDTGCISFFPGKNLGAFGDAGAVVTNNENLAALIKKLRVHGSKSKYVHDVIGYNSRLDNLQAAILSVKLKYLNKWTEARQKNAAYYNERLKGLPVTTPYVPSYCTHVYHQYTIRVPGKRDELMKYLNDSGIECRVYYPIPLHLQECFKFLGYKEGAFPESEKAMNEALSLPVYSEMTQEAKDYVISRIKEFFSK